MGAYGVDSAPGRGSRMGGWPWGRDSGAGSAGRFSLFSENGDEGIRRDYRGSGGMVPSDLRAHKPVRFPVFYADGNSVRRPLGYADGIFVRRGI